MSLLVSLHILILGIRTYETEGFLKSLRGEFLNTKIFFTGYVLLQVVVTIFQSTDLPNSHFNVFGGVDSESDPPNIDFKKNLPAHAI